MRNPEAAQLEDSIYDSGMALAPPDLSTLPPRMRYSIPENIRIASDLVKGPLRIVEKIEYPNRKGKISQAKVRIEYVPAIPWEKTGESRLEYGGIPFDRAKVKYAPRHGNCLWEFASLATVPAERLATRVLHFAQKWGVLRLCHHRKPENHRRANSKTGDLCGGPPRYGGISSPTVYSEPIEAWGRYSRQLRAMLLVAAKLRMGKLGNSRDWETIKRGEPQDLPSDECERWWPTGFRGQTALQNEGFGLSFCVGNWLAYGDVGLFPLWAKNSLQTGVTYHGLTGRLAAELCAMLSHGVYRCAGCERPFGVEWEGKMRARNRRTWCGSKECKRQAAREASRRHYEKRHQ